MGRERQDRARDTKPRTPSPGPGETDKTHSERKNGTGGPDRARPGTSQPASQRTAAGNAGRRTHTAAATAGRSGSERERAGRGGTRGRRTGRRRADGASETAASPLAVPWRGPSPHAVRLTSAGRTAGLDDGTGPAEGERRGVVGGSGALAVARVHEPGLSPAGGCLAPRGLAGSAHVGEPRGHGSTRPRLRSGLDGNPDGELTALLVEQVRLAEPVTARGSRAAGPAADRDPRRPRCPPGPADAGRGERHDPSVPWRCRRAADRPGHEAARIAPTSGPRRRRNGEGGTRGHGGRSRGK